MRKENRMAGFTLPKRPPCPKCNDENRKDGLTKIVNLLDKYNTHYIVYRQNLETPLCIICFDEAVSKRELKVPSYIRPRWDFNPIVWSG